MGQQSTYIRWIVIVLLTLGTSSAIFPVVSMQLSEIGTLQWNGYQVIEPSKRIDGDFRMVSRLGIQEAEEAKARKLDDSADPNPMPASALTLPLFPLEFGITLAATLAGAVLSIRTSRPSIVSAISLSGAAASLAAIMHLTIANASYHTWLQREAARAAISREDMFGMVARDTPDIIMNAIRFRPGIGLYALSAALFGAAILSQISAHRSPKQV
jgi:hypothetical protein